MDQITLARADRDKDCQSPNFLRHRLHDGPLQPRRTRPDLCPRRQRRLRARPLHHLSRRCRRHRPDHRRTVVCRRRTQPHPRIPARAVWGQDTLEENMAWLAESLGTKVRPRPRTRPSAATSPTSSSKTTCKPTKSAPSTGCSAAANKVRSKHLVYLHRYHEGTLARLRAEYVVPLTGKMAKARIEMLQKDATAATSTAARNKLAQRCGNPCSRNKHVELLAYDEQAAPLRRYAHHPGSG